MLDNGKWPSFVRDVRPWFVVTGDIPDMWLRDAVATVLPYRRDPHYRPMLTGTLLRCAEFILVDPYANSFHHVPRKKDATHPSPADVALGRSGLVATRNYELDSGCYFLQLWRELGYPRADAVVMRAAARMLGVWALERNHAKSPYSYPELTAEAQRVNASLGLTWSGYRPSDDMVEFGFHVPSQFFVVHELQALRGAAATWPGTAAKELDAAAVDLVASIKRGLQRAVQEVPGFGPVYCYEIDGYGGCNMMDDANVPSLLSLPYHAPGTFDEAIYANTRKWVLSSHNPYYYYYAGWMHKSGRKVRIPRNPQAIPGIGSPHTRRNYVWPMSLLVEALTDTNASAARAKIEALRGLRASWINGFVESFSITAPHIAYTRSWFEWPNALWSELLARHGLPPEPRYRIRQPSSEWSRDAARADRRKGRLPPGQAGAADASKLFERDPLSLDVSQPDSEPRARGIDLSAVRSSRRRPQKTGW